MIQVNELRTGNILNYHTAEGDILPMLINWNHLKWLDEDSKGFNLVHSPIPLSEEWLLKRGWIKHTQDKGPEFFSKLYGSNGVAIIKFREFYKKFCYELGQSNDKVITYVHELQNIFFTNTNHET